MQKFNVLLTAMTVIGAVLILAVSPTVADAAIVPNTATGDIAGTAADLDTTGSTFTLDITTLALVKAAFANGTQLTDGDQVAKGTLVQFLLYVDNPTNAAVDTLNVQDVLPAGFVYQAGTIITDDTTVSSGVWTETDLYNTITGSGTPKTDTVSGADDAGESGGTVSAGDGAGNGLLTVPADRVWGMVFTVRAQ